MGKRGPKPSPLELQLAKGDPGKRACRIVEAQRALGETIDEPMKEVRVPRCPSWLSATGKRVWKTLVPQLMALRLYQEIDEHAIAMLCHVWSEWHAARKKVKRPGRVQVTDTGYTSVTGEHTIERQLRLDFLRLCNEFGMTPSGRTGLAIKIDHKRGSILQWAQRASAQRPQGK